LGRFGTKGRLAHRQEMVLHQLTEEIREPRVDHRTTLIGREVFSCSSTMRNISGPNRCGLEEYSRAIGASMIAQGTGTSREALGKLWGSYGEAMGKVGYRCRASSAAQKTVR